MSHDSYWFTRGGMEHKARTARADDERNKQLKRIADLLERSNAIAEFRMSDADWCIFLEQYSGTKEEK
jgi:hypothetical protein